MSESAPNLARSVAYAVILGAALTLLPAVLGPSASASGSVRAAVAITSPAATGSGDDGIGWD